MRTDHQNVGEAVAAHLRAGRDQEALALAREATHGDPRRPEFWHALGASLRRTGAAADAERAFRRAVLLDPGFARSLGSMAALLAIAGRTREAASEAGRAFVAGPGLRDTALLLARLRPRPEPLRQAARRHAGEPALWTELAAVVRSSAQAEAKLALRRAAVLSPSDELPVRRSLSEPVTARAADAELAKVRRLAAMDGSGRPSWLQVSASQPIMLMPEDDPSALQARLADAVDGLADRLERSPTVDDAERIGSVTLFRSAYWGIDDTGLLARFGRGTTAAAAANMPVRDVPPPVRPEARSVALVTCHAFRHSVWLAIGHFWARTLRHAGIRTTLYDLYGLADADSAALFDSVDARPRSPHDWIQTLARAGHDVILYPELGMDPTALALANRRLAPLQATSWGHPCTSGLPTVDIFLGAERFDPPGAEAQYVERLVRLPGFGTEVWRDEFSGDGAGPVDRQPHLTRAGEHTLVVCQSVFKYLPDFDDLLADIASRHPPTRFLVFETGGADAVSVWKARVAGTFRRRGLDPDRHLRLVPPLPMERFMQVLAVADGYLDPPSFSGFTTGLRAVEARCPPVTLEGGRLRERLCAGLLREIGATRTIVGSRADYVDTAVRLMTDPGFRSECREALSAGRSALREDRGAATAFLDAIGLRQPG